MDFLFRCLNPIAEIADKNAELLYFLRIRVVVGPVYEGKLQPVKMLCYRFVCKQHEVLYDFRCRISFIRLDFQRMSFPVQYDFGFREIKIDGATLLPFRTQDSRQFFHSLEHGYQFLIFPAFLSVIILQYLFHAGIGHTPVHPYHGLNNTVIRHLAFLVNPHYAA